MKKIMVVTNNLHSPWLPILKEAILSLGILVPTSEQQVQEALQKERVNLIIVDTSGIITDVADLVTELYRLQSKTPILVVTTSPTWRRAREAFKAGAADYIRRSFDRERLLEKCREVLEQKQHPPPDN